MKVGLVGMLILIYIKIMMKLVIIVISFNF